MTNLQRSLVLSNLRGQVFQVTRFGKPEPQPSMLSPRGSRLVSQEVTAPSEAEPTRRAYLAMTPVV